MKQFGPENIQVTINYLAWKLPKSLKFPFILKLLSWSTLKFYWCRPDINSLEWIRKFIFKPKSYADELFSQICLSDTYRHSNIYTHTYILMYIKTQNGKYIHANSVCTHIHTLVNIFIHNSHKYICEHTQTHSHMHV